MVIPGNPAHRLRRWALVSLAAGLAAAALQLFEPLEHGAWLVAYLLLVGSLAPFLLAVGEDILLEGRTVGAFAELQPALWAFGTIVVPAGVLAETRLAVVLGSAALIAALGSMAATALAPVAGRPPPGGKAIVSAYAFLLLFMAVSTGIGLALAWDSPWM